MAELIRLKAPAKINLRLEVLDKRRDGYHILRMINTPVGLYDEVRVELNRSGRIEVSSRDPLVPAGKENLAYRAAEAMLKKAGEKGKGTGVRIRLRKRIPVAAGLAGGSSDAAAVLIGMRRAMSLNISQNRLLRIGLELGADVPFFIAGRPALVTGIGEKIEPIKNFPTWAYILLTPDFQLKTAWVFKHFQLDKAGRRPSKAHLLKKLMSGDPGQEFFRNDLEKIVFPVHPGVSSLKNELIQLGAHAAVMSGSGPTVVGVFEDREEAGRARARLKKRYPGYFCSMVSGVSAEDEMIF
jgi:4-diphosphocytidyl-2-C-methyl-D-erythritol kinase